MTFRQPDPEHSRDKLGLFVLAGLVVMVLGGVVMGVFYRQTVPDKGDVLLGGVVTGLILFLRDLVTAVRGSWEEVNRGKVTEQLAASGPVLDGPTPVTVTNSAAAPVHVTEDKP